MSGAWSLRRKKAWKGDAEVEGRGEALGGEGVGEDGVELVVETPGEEEGGAEIEDVRPQNGAGTAEGELEAVDEDGAAHL